MTSSRRTLIRAATLALTCAALASQAWAVPVNFTGTQQNFGLTLTASGQGTFTGNEPVAVMLIGLDYALGNVKLAPNGFDYVITNNPYSTPITLKNTVTLASDPRSIGLPKNPNGTFPTPGIGDIGVQGIFENGVANTYKLISASNLDLDMLNGKTVNFALAEIQIPRTQMFKNEQYDGNPINGPPYDVGAQTLLKLNVAGTVKEMYIEQDMTKLPTFTPDGPAIGGVSKGTFSIPSILNATLDATIKVGGFDVEKLENETLDTKLNVTGTYELTGPPSAMTMKLFGSNILPFPLGLNTGLVLDGGDVYGITSTVDLAASINFEYNFALITTVAIPEPGSIVLLVIGLMAVSPMMVVRLKRMVRRGRAA